jgi:hypothetical protein
VRKQLRRIKRLAILGGVIGVVLALRRAKAARDARQVLGPPATWPPLALAEPPVAAVGDLAAEPVAHDDSPTSVAESVVADIPVAAVGLLAAEDPLPTWVAAEEVGSCPVTHPVKANANSGIYHVPGGQFYERTRAERCYVDAASAEADGYRAARRTSASESANGAANSDRGGAT